MGIEIAIWVSKSMEEFFIGVEFNIFIWLLVIIFFNEEGITLFNSRKILFTLPGIITSFRFNNPLIAIGATNVPKSNNY